MHTNTYSYAVGMRALPSLTSQVLFLTISAILMTCCGDQLGYYSDEPCNDKTSGEVSESIDLKKWEPQRRIKRKREGDKLLSFETTPSSVLEYYVDDAEETRPYSVSESTLPSSESKPFTTSSDTLPDVTPGPALSDPSLSLIEEQLRKLRLLASTKDTSDERNEGSDEDTEDYSFY